jgi:putative transposase
MQEWWVNINKNDGSTCAGIYRCEANEIKLLFIQRGKPMQNGFVERNNGSLRKELLDAYLFFTLQEVRLMAEQWQKDYNEERPHESLGNVPPTEYIQSVSL